MCVLGLPIGVPFISGTNEEETTPCLHKYQLANTLETLEIPVSRGGRGKEGDGETVVGGGDGGGTEGGEVGVGDVVAHVDQECLAGAEEGDDGEGFVEVQVGGMGFEAEAVEDEEVKVPAGTILASGGKAGLSESYKGGLRTLAPYEALILLIRNINN